MHTTDILSDEVNILFKNKSNAIAGNNKNTIDRLKRELVMNKYLYIMAIPVLLYYIIFHYYPLYGALIAFKRYDLAAGVWGSPWVGLDNFMKFFNSIYFARLIKNTLIINLYMLIFEFPAPIILALLLNEVRSKKYKSVVQTVSYLPHFVSMVVICGMIVDFCSREGMITQFLGLFGMEQTNLLVEPKYFRTIYVTSAVWQQIGWSSIIYLGCLSGIDDQLYEAATVDGAGRFRKAISITLPGIMPMIITMFIMRIGNALTIGFEKIMLLYNQNTMEVADVMSTYVYRNGLLEGTDFSYTTAVGLFNSIVNFMLLVIANAMSKKFTQQSLW